VLKRTAVPNQSLKMVAADTSEEQRIELSCRRYE